MLVILDFSYGDLTDHSLHEIEEVKSDLVSFLLLEQKIVIEKHSTKNSRLMYLCHKQMCFVELLLHANILL